jgi:hypothetical protein
MTKGKASSEKRQMSKCCLDAGGLQISELRSNFCSHVEMACCVTRSFDATVGHMHMPKTGEGRTRQKCF